MLEKMIYKTWKLLAQPMDQAKGNVDNEKYCSFNVGHIFSTLSYLPSLALSWLCDTYDMSEISHSLTYVTIPMSVTLVYHLT